MAGTDSLAAAADSYSMPVAVAVVDSCSVSVDYRKFGYCCTWVASSAGFADYRLHRFRKVHSLTQNN